MAILGNGEMFIKRDERKIPEILLDTEDDRSRLLLSKRSHEFDGKLEILCRDNHLKQLKNLKVLNMYENQLESLDGIGLLSKTPLEDLNLGNNLVKQLPAEFGGLSTLKSLWLDDNRLDTFPVVLCSLTNLTELRLSSNQIAFVPQSISTLRNLTTLALDNNKLTEFPIGILELVHLEHLWIRQNLLIELPENIIVLNKLRTLSVSSNEIEVLPSALASMETLTCIFANANKIRYIDEKLCTLPSLKKLNLANNRLEYVPTTWSMVWGDYNPDTGKLEKTDNANCSVTLSGNNL